MEQRTYSISFFFPAYNEEENIEAALHEARSALDACAREYEIIVVNDGSMDRTAEIVEKISLEDARIRLISHATNRGYGAALHTGIAAARYEYVFFTDADLQFRIADISHLLAYIPHYTAVIGYRKQRKDHVIRLLNAWGWNILNRILFDLKVTDIDCAFKLFERKMIQSIRLTAHGATASAEMLIRLKSKGILWYEVPVTHLPRTFGNPTGARLFVILSALKEIFALYSGDLGNPVHKQMLRFGIVGIINTAIDVLAYIFLTRFFGFFGVRIVLAKTFSFTLGTISSLYLNRSWTFRKNTRISYAEIAKFYTTASTSLLLNTVSMFFLAERLGINDIISVCIATVVTFAWNFTLSHLWVFAPRPSIARERVEPDQ